MTATFRAVVTRPAAAGKWVYAGDLDSEASAALGQHEAAVRRARDLSVWGDGLSLAEMAEHRRIVARAWQAYVKAYSKVLNAQFINLAMRAASHCAASLGRATESA